MAHLYAQGVSVGTPRNADEMYQYCLALIHREASMGFTNLIFPWQFVDPKTFVRYGAQWYRQLADRLRQEDYTVDMLDEDRNEEDKLMMVNWGT